jgi:hypothetical protein
MDVEQEYLSAMLLDHITRQIIPSSSSITTVGEWYKFMCSRMSHSEWQLGIIPFMSMMHRDIHRLVQGGALFHRFSGVCP